MEYTLVNNTKKKEALEKKHNNMLKKIEHYELLLTKNLKEEIVKT